MPDGYNMRGGRGDGRGRQDGRGGHPGGMPSQRRFPRFFFFPVHYGPHRNCWYIDRYGRCCDRYGRCCDQYGRCGYDSGPYWNPTPGGPAPYGDGFDGSAPWMGFNDTDSDRY